MNDNIIGFKAALAAVCATLTALWGWFGWLVLAWVGCMALDYVAGSAAALRNGEWNSTVARNGIWHKVGCIVAVIVAGVLDVVIALILDNIPALALPFNYTVFFAPLVVVWYIFTEVGSLVENAGKMGAPIPTWLAKAIASLRAGVDGVGEKMGEQKE